ncbi:MAG: hypothetical protein LQ343_003297 [Gyalolechia ehrenbergii]|nr:MAG: hypothetical protein LQ343_003297 [Gyalolechia ehrenbergii]
MQSSKVRHIFDSVHSENTAAAGSDSTPEKENSQGLPDRGIVTGTSESNPDKTILKQEVNSTATEAITVGVAIPSKQSTGGFQQLFCFIMSSIWQILAAILSTQGWLSQAHELRIQAEHQIGEQASASLLHVHNTRLERQLAEALRDKEKAIKERDSLKKELFQAQEKLHQASQQRAEKLAKAKIEGA